MSKRGGSGQDRRQEFLKAVEKQKLDTIRWSLQYGGQHPGTRDDDGNTAIMIAASQGLRKAMQVLLEVVRKQREIETLNLTDGQGDGKTAIMMAAAAGHYDLVQDLKDAGANWKLKCSEGLTAEDYARQSGKAEIAAYFARGCQSESEDDEDGAGGDDGGGPEIEGETSNQRRKRIKKEKEAAATRGRSTLREQQQQQQQQPQEGKAEEEEEEAEAEEGPIEAQWEEVAKALVDPHLVQLTIERKNEAAPATVDPALWRCRHLNSLTLRLGAALTSLPSDGLGKLKGLRTLIVSHNALTSLPPSVCSLPLRVLEAEGNAIAALPEGFAKLDALETLNLSHNKLASVAGLRGCKGLVSLSLDGNQLTTLEGLGLAAMPRLTMLSARSNKIKEIPEEIESCALLAEIYLSGNQIEDVPSALGNLKEKKVRVLEISGNPLSDPKIRKMLDKSGTFVKELLTYLRKSGGGGGGKKGQKGKKGKKAESSEEDEEDEEQEEAAAEVAPAAPAAAAPASSKDAAEAPQEVAAAAAAGSTGGVKDAQAEEETAAAAPPVPAAAAAAKPSGKPLSKKELLKEKERAERKAAEEAMKARTAAAKEKEKEKEAKRLQQLQEMDAAAAKASDGYEDETDEWEVPQRGAGAGASGSGAGGYLYSMTPEQLKEAEAQERKRLEEERQKKEAELQRQKASKEEQEAAEAERRMAALALRDKKGGDQYTWEFSGGQFVKKHLEAGQQAPRLTASTSHLPANAYCVSAELPAMMMGRIIGKGGESIRATEAKSGAHVKLLQAGDAKLSPGMGGILVTGTHASIESARALVNKCLTSSRPPNAGGGGGGGGR